MLIDNKMTNDNKTLKFFPVQKEAVPYAQENEHEFFFASDKVKLNEDGSKKIVKKYGSCKNLAEFLKIYKKLDAKDKILYEWFSPSMPVCEYYDIDFDFEKNQITKTAEQVFCRFNSIHAEFVNFIDCKDGYTDWRITDSSKAGIKVSIHLVNRGRVFKDHDEIKKWKDDFVAFWQAHYCDEENLFDVSVYGKNQCMRMIESTKVGQKRPLEPAYWHEVSKNAAYTDFFVQNVDTKMLIKQSVQREERIKLELEHEKEYKKREKLRLKEEATLPDFEIIDSDLNDAEKLVNLIVDFVKEKKHSLCDKEFPDKLNYNDMRNLSFAFINARKDEAQSELEIKEVWEETIYSLYRHGGGIDASNNVWTSLYGAREKLNGYTIKSLHYWARENPGYFFVFRKVKLTNAGIYNAKDDSYYWGDFRRMITTGVFSSYQDLQKAFVENFNRVCVVAMKGSDNFYIKTEGDPFTRTTIDLIARYEEKNAKGAVQTVNLNFKQLYDMNIDEITRYNGVVFEPYDILKDSYKNEKLFNMYFGMKANFVENVDLNLIQPILDHINLVWANEEELKFKYLLSWMAHIVQKPNKQSKVMLILYSDAQQVGKGIIAEYLVNKIFGLNVSGKTEDLDKVVGRFNGFIQNKIFTVLDDTSSHDSYKNGTWNKLKSLITDSTQTIERKGIEIETIVNYNNFMLLTNQANAVKIDSKDARMAVFKCNESKAGDRKYFNKLVSLLESDEVCNHFYTYLYLMSDLIDPRDIPRTKEKVSMEYATAEQPIKFFHDIKNGDFSLEKDEIFDGYMKSTTLYVNFLNWSSKNGEKQGIYSQSKFDGYATTELGEKVRKRVNKEKNQSTCFNVVKLIVEEKDEE
jgi:hypothetical protein